jgi:hypothetical protein
MVSDALAALKATVPREVAPSKNCTVPVAPEDGATVAVSVTGCPNVDGFSDEISVVTVAAAFTVCVREEEILPVKCVSPL